MQNVKAQGMVDDCSNEMTRIEHLIEGIGSTSPASGFLTKYALMKMSGTLERVYKTLIADHYKSFSNELEHFIDTNVMNAYMNASYDNILKMLSNFDNEKNKEFKNKVQGMSDYNKCCQSFSSLNDIRNNIVHGGSAIPSFADLRMMYDDSIKIIEKLDEVMA